MRDFPWWSIVVIVSCIISGVMTVNLARKKGYEGYFWTGFFLSIWGLIYVAGLPLEKDVAIEQGTEPDPTPGSGKVCPSCGYVQSLPRKRCWKCGTTLDQ